MLPNFCIYNHIRQISSAVVVTCENTLIPQFLINYISVKQHCQISMRIYCSITVRQLVASLLQPSKTVGLILRPYFVPAIFTSCSTSGCLPATISAGMPPCGSAIQAFLHLYTQSGRIGKVIASHAVAARSIPVEVALIYTMHETLRVGGATSQLDLPSLMPLSIAGCG